MNTIQACSLNPLCALCELCGLYYVLALPVKLESVTACFKMGCLAA